MSEQLCQVYADRNNVVQLAARLAQQLGYRSGVRRSTLEEEWVVVAIDLPAVGEVAWHVPRGELLLSTTNNLYEADWDGHTDKDKALRIRDWVMDEPVDPKRFFEIQPSSSSLCGLHNLTLTKSKYPTPKDRLEKLAEWIAQVDDQLFDPEEKIRLLAVAPRVFERNQGCEIHLKRDQGFWVVYLDE